MRRLLARSRPSRGSALLLVLLSGTAWAPGARAQTPGGGGTANTPLAVSVDCPGSVPGCDVAFFQTEIGFVRIVRDVADADVAALVTSQETGGGGRSYTLFLRGRRGPAAGRLDTLAVRTEPGASDDARRRALVGRLALGLAGFAAQTGLADRLTVAYAAPADAPPPARDPWNNWVFSVNGNGYFNGQQSQSSVQLFGFLSAARVTDRWKLSVRPNSQYNRSTFSVNDSTTVVSTNASTGVFAQAVRALGPKWSAAARLSGRRSTFQNYGARVVGGPAVEYNVFDYAESTRRQLRLSYALEGEAVAYVDTTIFGRTSERNVLHTLGAAAVFAQPWGSTNVGVDLSQILTRPDKYRATLSGDLSVRIARGLNVTLNGYVALVRDQIGLRAAGASDEEILTQQRELATGYEYFAGVGLSYSFGSIFNPVVNARFGN